MTGLRRDAPGSGRSPSSGELRATDRDHVSSSAPINRPNPDISPEGGFATGRVLSGRRGELWARDELSGLIVIDCRRSGSRDLARNSSAHLHLAMKLGA